MAHQSVRADREGLPVVVAERGSLQNKVRRHCGFRGLGSADHCVQVWEMYGFMMQRLSQVRTALCCTGLWTYDRTGLCADEREDGRLSVHTHAVV